MEFILIKRNKLQLQIMQAQQSKPLTQEQQQMSMQQAGEGASAARDAAVAAKELGLVGQ